MRQRDGSTSERCAGSTVSSTTSRTTPSRQGPSGDAIVRWCVLDDDHRAAAGEAPLWASTGHTAAVFGNELYDTLPPTRGGYGRLQDFGIRFGNERVVLHIEPQDGVAGVECNTARTFCCSTIEPLPWTRWARSSPPRCRADPAAPRTRRDLGLALTAPAQSDRFSRVIAIDDHRGDLSGVIWRVVDIRDPGARRQLAGIDVIVHTDLDLAADSDPRARRAFNVRGAQTVLTAAAAGGVGRVVLITSAMVYGASPDNPVPIDERAPLLAEPDGSVVGDFMEIEQLAERSRTKPGMEITVVPQAALVGESIDTLITRHFEAPRLLAVKGCAPRWQFCHVADLLSAIEVAAAGDVSGAFAVGSAGWLEQDQVEELSGLRRIELPAAVTFATAQRLHRAGITPAPVSDLHYVVYPWVVDCRTLREAGWRLPSPTPKPCRRCWPSGRGTTRSPGGAWPGRTRRSRRPGPRSR